MSTITLIIINGVGGSGKSLFCSYCKEWGKVQISKTVVEELSIVDWPKEVAKYCGWSGAKEAKDRKFLNDIKFALVNWDNSPIDKMFDRIKERKEIDEYDNRDVKNYYYFINSRESYDIEAIEKKAISSGYNIFKLKVTSPRSDTKAEVPFILDEINKVKYDFEIANDGLMSDLEDKAYNFMAALKNKINTVTPQICDVKINEESIVKREYNCPDCGRSTCKGCPRVSFLPYNTALPSDVPSPKLDYIGYEPHIPQCCINCSNHPSNGGSGICNCTLPYMTHTPYTPYNNYITATNTTDNMTIKF